MLKPALLLAGHARRRRLRSRDCKPLIAEGLALASALSHTNGVAREAGIALFPPTSRQRHLVVGRRLREWSRRTLAAAVRPTQPHDPRKALQRMPSVQGFKRPLLSPTADRRKE